MFDALVHGRVDTEGLHFAPVLTDIEALNERAMRQELAITKLSYHAWLYVREQYAMLPSGSALGRGVGPLLVTREPIAEGDIPQLTVAIPGQYTTAHYLMRLAYPDLRQRISYLFSDIETAVLEGEVDAGLLIHENRFTYADKGLVCLRDMGTFWEETTGLPIPLGGIAVRRDVPLAVQQAVARVLRRSVAYAFEHPAAAAPYVAEHAQAMSAEVCRQHIALYVNDFSLDLGEEGRAAVQSFHDQAVLQGLVSAIDQPLWVPVG